MRTFICAIFAASMLAMAPRASAQAVDAAVRADVAVANATTAAVNVNNNWRYRRHNGRWWYYTPQRSWMVWDGGAWNPYQSGSNFYVGRGYNGYYGGPAYYGRANGYYGPGYNGYYGRGYYGPYRSWSGYRGYGGGYGGGGAGVYIGRGGVGINF